MLVRPYTEVCFGITITTNGIAIGAQEFFVHFVHIHFCIAFAVLVGHTVARL